MTGNSNVCCRLSAKQFWSIIYKTRNPYKSCTNNVLGKLKTIWKDKNITLK